MRTLNKIANFEDFEKKFQHEQEEFIAICLSLFRAESDHWHECGGQASKMTENRKFQFLRQKEKKFPTRHS